MMPTLIGVTLRAFDGDVEPIEQVPAHGLRTSLDIDSATVEIVQHEGLAVQIEFALVIQDPDGQLIADLSATFRLLYNVGSLQAVALISRDMGQEFASTRAATDAWPYWLTFLRGAMASMGLVPVRLPGSIPPDLAGHVRRAFALSRALEAAG